MDYFEDNVVVSRRRKIPETPVITYSPNLKAVEIGPLVLRLFIASYVIFGMTVFSFSWIMLYTFNPDFVKVTHQHEIFSRPHAEPDPVKCFMVSVGISFASIFLLWAFTRK
jgi:hypothetical protein